MILDITGYTLKEALAILHDNGVENILIKLTAPPRCIDTAWHDDSRVVRVKLDANGFYELSVCNIDSTAVNGSIT